MDTDQFCAPPMTTGGLKAYFVAHGRSAARSEVELVHFGGREHVLEWLDGEWNARVLPRLRSSLDAGDAPVVGLSCYTWNVAEFLEVARRVRAEAPGTLVVAGGPHVQRAEDFLHDEAIDVVVLGEGEETFTELLDCGSREEWANVAGCAYLDPDGRLHRTAPRARATDLDRYPSALDVVALRDSDGTPLYRQVAYETSRGCPYRCSFCEWGTGAIGTKMYQFSLERIRGDLERLVDGGLQDIWLCDSNFGALKEDLAKAEMFVELRRRTGRPRTFATSWSKNHNQRVRQIVRLLNGNGLLWHYHLALQTLTPRALELSHRTNMRANDYEPLARELAAEGVPVTAELIWGLPGDTLAEFETNLDHLFSVFPNINIFAYTLLPGTEFFERRDEYRLETLEVAGYGKAKGEYVVGCHTFSREEGEEGYFLVAAHVMLSRGHVVPLTLRLLALDGRVSVSALLRAMLRALNDEFGIEAPPGSPSERMAAYENRAPSYVAFLAEPDRAFDVIRRTVFARLAACGALDLAGAADATLRIDQALCPRVGPTRTVTFEFPFDAYRVIESLGRMKMPAPACFEARGSIEVEVYHPAAVGEVLIDPDGGAWMQGRITSTPSGERTGIPVQFSGATAATSA
jgi:radical SAM superfamily enzyme YgiQ (UPF0313 family)